jgi:hypothetical protein
VGVAGVLVWVRLGGFNSVVTSFLCRGSFLMRVNCSVSVVAAGSLTASFTSLEVVLLVIVAGCLLSSLEVTVLLLGGGVLVVIASVASVTSVVALSVVFGFCFHVVCSLLGFVGGLG